MERFLGALSITLLLSGWAAVTQFQNLQDPLAPQAELSEFHPAAPSGSLLGRSELISILAKALRLNRSQADYPPLGQADHAQSNRQVSVVPLPGLSPFSEMYSDIQIVLHNNMPQDMSQYVPQYREGQFYLDRGITHAKAFSRFAQPYDAE